jgi:hypothetical protein
MSESVSKSEQAPLFCANRNDVADRSPHQTADSRADGEQPFLPHLLQDRLAEARLKADARFVAMG